MISLRAGAFFEDRNLPRTFAGNRSLVLDAGSTFDFGIAQLTAQILRIELDLDANRLRGIPVDNEGHFLADRRWNHNEPSDFLDLRSTTIQARLDVEPTDNLKLDASLRHIDAVETQKYHEPITLLDSNRDGRFDGVGGNIATSCATMTSGPSPPTRPGPRRWGTASRTGSWPASTIARPTRSSTAPHSPAAPPRLPACPVR